MTVMTMDLKISSDASHLQSGIKTRLQVAERDSEEARKIFGIDQMSTEERKVELCKATLVCFPDLLVKQNFIFFIQDLAGTKKVKTTLVWLSRSISIFYGLLFNRTLVPLRKATNFSSST